MSFTSEVLEAPGQVAAGAPVVVNPRSAIILAIAGSFTATVQLEYSPFEAIDKWFSAGSALTAAGFQVIPAGRAKRVRARTTAHTTGSPKGVVLHDRVLEALRREREFREFDIVVPLAVEAGEAVVFSAATARQQPDCVAALLVLLSTAAFVADVQFEFSPSPDDDDFWFPWGPLLSNVNGKIWLPEGYAVRVRARTAAYTSGTPLGRGIAGLTQEQDVRDGMAAIVASGAVDPAVGTVLITVDGTVGYTLADGAREGQEISLRVTAAINTPNGTLTPDTFADGTSISLDAVGEEVTLRWFAIGGWRVVSIAGATIT